MKVVIFHNIVAPYRHALFAEIGKRLDLTVLYSALVTKDRSWSTEIPNTYRSKVLSSRMIYWGNRPVIVVPGLEKEITDLRPRVVLSVLTRSNFIDVLRIAHYCRVRAIPLVLWVGNVESDEPRFFSTRVVDWISEMYFRKAIAHASGFVFYSKASEEWAVRRGARGPAVVGGQVLAEAQSKPREKERDDGTFIGLFVGKLEARKGIKRMISLFQSSLSEGLGAELNVLFVGTGPLAAELRDTVPRDPRVHFSVMGPCFGEALRDVYRSADFLILPSNHEPWGFVVNEAMSLGTPVLCAKQCGASELAELAGWVFDAFNYCSFSKTLRLAIAECRSPGIRQRAIQAERKYRPESFVRELVPMLIRVGEG